MIPLRVENLYKSFDTGLLSRKVEVLHGISFQLEQGEIFGLLGRNGVGKTTTLKTVVGLLTPDRGTVEIFGAPPSSVEARSRLGFLPEHPYFYGYLTGREFLEMAAALHGLSGATARKRIDGLLEAVNMTHAASRALRKYSKGMLQRIGLAQALVGEPDLVVLDEPLSGLDPVGRRELKEVILQLRKRGSTVIFSSHILSDVEEICDRVGLVENGRLALVQSVDTLLARGTEHTEVEIAGDCTDLAGRFSDLHLMERAGVTVFVVPDSDMVQQVISSALSCGCTVLSVRPHRKTLEELVLEEQGRSDSTKEERS